MEFSSKHVVVTGATKGIGKAISLHFLNHGAKVTAIYSRDDQAAKELESLALNLEGQLELKKFDVSDLDAVKTFYNNMDEQGLDILINNVGMRRDQVVAMLEEEDFDKVMQVNFNSAFYMSKYAVPYFMKKRFGRIVNMSSVGSRYCFSGQASYASSKGALNSFTKTLAKEVAKKGITVNSVSPGFIDTELIADLPAEQIKEYKKQVPMKRFGKPEEVAELVAFLCSDKASYITGTDVEIAGGL
ncbi:MAG: SDR family oxidoreductase [Bacteriovoracaceae bacterium]